MGFKSLFFLILFVLLGINNVISQNLLETSGKNIINQSGDTIILRGIGLGGWMLQEGYMMSPDGFSSTQFNIKNKLIEIIGAEETANFYDLWLKNHVRKIDIDSLKSWGFNLVRAPIHYNLFTLPIEDEPFPNSYTELNKGYELLDSLLSWCSENEVYLMIDLHGAPGGQGYNADISDYDSTKLSLWESEFNQNKTVELWKRIAERYKDEQWVAGYDLINEPNWNLPDGVLLRELYGKITNAIRTVDINHILFIEGNDFANNFTGLTPPWDDNMVYSPHKYWSPVDQGYLDWMLPLRDSLNVPIFVGETGENSNFWYRDAVKVFEENGIGWAWWPLKRIGAIQPPLSINYNDNYKKLVEYWKGGDLVPTKEEALSGLLQLTEDIKLENCFYHKDIIDAMFRQPFSDETIPYFNNVIPGKIFSTDFDMGIMGSAYHDQGSEANYGGNFSPWNNGWALRNDNVDIQKNEDSLSNGYNVGWIETDEWMKYTFKNDSSGLYNVKVRVATEDDKGKFHFKINGAKISDIISVPNTGGWQNWQFLVVDSLVLHNTDNELMFYANSGTYNLSLFNFEKIGDLSAIETRYNSSFTLNENTIVIYINKPMDNTVFNLNEFILKINGTEVIINAINIGESSRILNIVSSSSFTPSDTIEISYNGSSINSIDGLLLNTFSELVTNSISIVHSIPGKIQAEEYFYQSGILLESTTDEGSGQNIGGLDNGDYADYYVDIEESGAYNVIYRSAADPAWSSGGQVELKLLDEFGNFSTLQNVLLPVTTGWQDWSSVSKSITLPKGKHQIRLQIIEGPFNLNWFSFDDSVSLGIPIPGLVQAEDYVFQNGISLESTEDEGGGQNIGYLDSLDYADYILSVTKTGVYDISYRVAADGSQDYANGGTIEMQLILDSINSEILHTASFQPTTGWQDWVTYKNFSKIQLEAGERKIRLMFRKTPFNLNWILFEDFDGPILTVENNISKYNIYPNPSNYELNIESYLDLPTNIKFQFIDTNGLKVLGRSRNYSDKFKEVFNTSSFNSGLYFLMIFENNIPVEIHKIIIK